MSGHVLDSAGHWSVPRVMGYWLLSDFEKGSGRYQKKLAALTRSVFRLLIKSIFAFVSLEF
jgi:hypothetical protein